MYVYLSPKSGDIDRLYTVGFYDPNGKWHPESDHDIAEEAAKRVRYLNGEKETVEVHADSEIKPWDYFAGQALEGLLSNGKYTQAGIQIQTADGFAYTASLIANAMMKARKP